MIALHLEDSLAMDKTAYGLLSTMLNVPIFDNVGIEQLMKASPDSESVIHKALYELIEKGYVIRKPLLKFSILEISNNGFNVKIIIQFCKRSDFCAIFHL